MISDKFCCYHDNNNMATTIDYDQVKTLVSDALDASKERLSEYILASVVHCQMHLQPVNPEDLSYDKDHALRVINAEIDDFLRTTQFQIALSNVRDALDKFISSNQGHHDIRHLVDANKCCKQSLEK